MLGTPDMERALERLLENGEKADLFMTSVELLEADNYLRAFDEEISILGEDRANDAVEAAKKREPKGFEAMLKQTDMMELFRLGGKEEDGK